MGLLYNMYGFTINTFVKKQRCQIRINTNIKRVQNIESAYISNNTKAIKLYEKCGFKKYGVKPDSMKYSDGSNASMDWMMVKL